MLQTKYHSHTYTWLELGHHHALQWHHNELAGISNHQSHDCLLNRLFTRRSKKTSKLQITGLCEGNSPVTGEFPAQRASNAENVSIWWCHHAADVLTPNCAKPSEDIMLTKKLGKFSSKFLWLRVILSPLMSSISQPEQLEHNYSWHLKWSHKLTGGPFYYYGLTLIPAWISNYIHYKMWDELLIHS